MKPIKKTIYSEYWACTIEEHRHKTKEIAERCIKANINRKPAMTQTERDARNIVIAREVINGKTYKYAGSRFKLSGERAVQLFTKVNREIEKLDNPLAEPWTIEHTSLKDKRANKEYWLKLIDIVAINWDVK